VARLQKLRANRDSAKVNAALTALRDGSLLVVFGLHELNPYCFRHRRSIE
jgi:hypothetical protein